MTIITNTLEPAHLPSFEIWEELYTCIDTAANRYPVEDWSVGPSRNAEIFNEIDLWPIIKTAFLLRAANYFHTETGKRVLISELDKRMQDNKLLTAGGHLNPPVFSSVRNRKLEEFKDKLKSIGIGRAAKSWPKTHSEILMIGANINSYDVGGMLVQNHLDPLRLAFEAAGHRTATFLTDVPGDHPDLQRCLLGGTYGIKKEFDTARTLYDSNRLIDFANLDGFPQFLAEISNIFDIESITTRKIISNLVRQSLSSYQVFRDYLKVEKYKAVGIYCYYGIAGFGLSLACRENGIPLFDVQHGVSGEGHESYSYPNAPEAGYNSIPTHFLCWTSQEAKFISSHLKGYSNRVINVGHSWKLTEDVIFSDKHLLPLVNRSRHLEALEGYKDQKTEATETLSRVDGLKNILVATYTNEPLTWLKPFIEAFKDRAKVFVRLHPGEAKNTASIEKRKLQFKDMDVEFLSSTNLAIPIVLPHMDLVVNRYSSIVRDAAAYGIQSLCYSKSAKWYHNPSKFKGVHIVEFTTDDIIQGAENILFSSSDKDAVEIEAHATFSELRSVCKSILMYPEATT